MFAGIKKMWAEARAEPVEKMVMDIIAHYQRMHPLDKDQVQRSYKYALHDLESEYGDSDEWTDDLRKEVAKNLFTVAKKAAANPYRNIDGDMQRVGSNGLAMLSFYIEMAALKTPKAKQIMDTIQEWSVSPTGYKPSF